MRLGVVCCGNGLGHAKRAIRICSVLARRCSDIDITLFLDDVTASRVRDWSVLAGLLATRQARVARAELPMRWSEDASTYAGWLLGWEDSVGALGLDEFDAVLSDNLVEPLRFADDVALAGSFFWHDVLRSSFPGDDTVREYADRCDGLLAARRPMVLANRYFAMPRVRREPGLQAIGLVPFVRRRADEAPRRLSRILLAPGNADMSEALLGALSRLVRELGRTDAELLADPRLIARLGDAGGSVRPAAGPALDAVDAAVVRGGMGTISDCVAARVPMLYVDDPNPEIRFNHERIEALGIGCAADELDAAEFGDDARWAAIVRAMVALDLDGADQAASALMRHWNCDAP